MISCPRDQGLGEELEKIRRTQEFRLKYLGSGVLRGLKCRSFPAWPGAHLHPCKIGAQEVKLTLGWREMLEVLSARPEEEGVGWTLESEARD